MATTGKLTWNGQQYTVGAGDRIAPYVLVGRQGGRVELVRNLASGLLLPVYVGKGRTMPRPMAGAFRDDGALGLREAV
jgi:hypothetical protein